MLNMLNKTSNQKMMEHLYEQLWDWMEYLYDQMMEYLDDQMME